jgi:thymidylate kinase
LQLCREIFHSVQDDFVAVIDADQSIEEIQAAIFAVVSDLVGNSPS